MTTRTTFRANVQDFLGTAISGVVSTNQLNLWLDQAILDYSLHFPRKKQAVVATTSGKNYYDLPEDVHGILSVAYQVSVAHGGANIKPVYYRQKNIQDSDFFQVENRYDIIQKSEDGSATGTLGQLVVSAAPTVTNDDYLVDYHGDHQVFASDAGVLTVPDRHWHLLMMFVRWKAIQALARSGGTKTTTTTGTAIHVETDEVLDSGLGSETDTVVTAGGTVTTTKSWEDPTVTTDRDVVTTPGSTTTTEVQSSWLREADVAAAERAYRAAIAAAKGAESDTGVNVWRMDKWGGRY